MNFFHRTKKAMWEKLAHEINQEFRCHMTPLQVENKGKSMERAYKKTKIKNSSSGHSRTACEYEGYGQQTFSHHCFTHVPTQHNFFECGFLTESFPKCWSGSTTSPLSHCSPRGGLLRKFAFCIIFILSSKQF